MKLYSDYIKNEYGYWTIEAEDQRLTALKWTESKPEIKLERSFFTDGVLKHLIGYFEGHKIDFQIPLKLDDYTDFQVSVWKELMNIPYGTTISYKHLARKLGNPSAIRAVASANGKNPFPIIVPCHRVIGTDGSMTGYAYGISLKQRLLDLENAIPVKQMTLF